MVDEFTRECLVMRVARRLRSEDVIDTLADLFLQRGTPAYLRSDNGAEFTAKAVRKWLKALVADLSLDKTILHEVLQKKW